MLMADDEYIDAIYSYCDRWCETCAFTSRCRVFADVAAHAAADDPGFVAVVTAPPLPHIPPPPSPEVLAMIEGANEALASMTPEEIEAVRLPRVAEEHEPLEDRARGYGLAACQLMRALGHDGIHTPSDSRAIVQWDSHLIPAKVHRALTGIDLIDDDDDDGFPRDCDGSAKVALIAIDRSEAAWQEMARVGHVAHDVAMPFVESLAWLRDELERVFPNARAFVRPGFDETQG
jgi:hypothetical protein